MRRRDRWRCVLLTALAWGCAPPADGPTDTDDTAATDTAATDTADTSATDTGATSDTEDTDDTPRDCTEADRFLDTATGLCWQDPPVVNRYNWGLAKSTCDALTLDGHSDWRLPTIDELRTLIRGCSGTEPGGFCEIAHDCTTASCWDSACNGCTHRAGPGDGGCYWDPTMQGPCERYWSATPSSTDHAYYLGFEIAEVNSGQLTVDNGASVRCVRDGP